MNPSDATVAFELYDTAWACTGVEACIEFDRPAPGVSDDIEATMSFPDGTRSCGASIHTEGLGSNQIVQVDGCSFWSGMGVTLMEQTWMGSVPDGYDMVGGYRLYDGGEYWGSLPSYCEPLSRPGRD